MAQESENVVELAGEDSPARNRGKATFIDVLRNTGFRNLWIGQVVSQVGDYFAFLATMVVVSGFSQDAQSTTLAVSGMMIAQTLPRLLFGLPSGVFVDRWDRRRTMLVSDVARSLLAIAFIPAFLSKNLYAMYAIGFLLASVGTLFNPAKGALIPRLVPRDQLLSANSLSQASMILSMLLGPALAGFTLGVVGSSNTWLAFLIDALSFAVSAVAIFLIRLPRKVAAPEQAPASEEGGLRKVWQELVVGLKALFLNRTMVTLSVVFIVTMLGVGAINVLWITFLKTSFGFQTSELAWRIAVMDTGFSLGMIITTVAVGNFLSHLAPKWLIVWGLILAGLTTMVLGYIPDYWVLVADMVLVGGSVAPINSAVGTLVQIIVPNSQLGRVGGGLQTMIDSATLVSMSLAGALGAALGIPVVFLIGGLLCLAAGSLAWAFIPALTLKDKVEEPAPAALEEDSFYTPQAVA